MQRSRRRPLRRGFTLLEVLIVLAIIGVIAAMAVPQLLGQQRQANIKATKLAISNLEQSLNLYAVGHGGLYPENVQVLLQRGEDMSPAVLDKIPLDSWNSPLNYEFPNSKAKTDKPAIWSNGENRKNENGSGDDINNWSDLAQIR